MCVPNKWPSAASMNCHSNHHFWIDSRELWNQTFTFLVRASLGPCEHLTRCCMFAGWHLHLFETSPGPPGWIIYSTIRKLTSALGDQDTKKTEHYHWSKRSSKLSLSTIQFIPFQISKNLKKSIGLSKNRPHRGQLKVQTIYQASTGWVLGKLGRFHWK